MENKNNIDKNDLSKWFVGQKCGFISSIGTIIEIDKDHICPILWKSDTDKQKEYRFYADGLICRSIKNEKLKPL